jgi:hypothetical protein
VLHSAGTDRRDADAGNRAHDPIGKSGRARESVRSPSGDARDPEAFDPELVGQQDDVVDFVDHAAPVAPAGNRIARPVVRDEEDPELRVEILIGPAIEARTRAAVVPEHGKPVWVSPRPEGERPPLRGFQRLQALRQPPTIIRPCRLAIPVAE